jgi:hypothetical protein
MVGSPLVESLQFLLDQKNLPTSQDLLQIQNAKRQYNQMIVLLYVNKISDLVLVGVKNVANIYSNLLFVCLERNPLQQFTSGLENLKFLRLESDLELYQIIKEADLGKNFTLFFFYN